MLKNKELDLICNDCGYRHFSEKEKAMTKHLQIATKNYNGHDSPQTDADWIISILKNEDFIE